MIRGLAGNAENLKIFVTLDVKDMRYIQLLVCVLLILLAALPVYSQENPTPLTNLVFQGKYSEEIERPAFPHEFVLLKPPPPPVSYFPDITLKEHALKTYAAYNVEPIVGFFDFMGNLFSDRKEMNEIYQLEKNNQLEQAYQEYSEMAENKGTYQNEARVRQIIINIKLNRLSEAKKQAETLSQLSDPHYSTEGFFLKQLVMLINKKYRLITEEIKNRRKNDVVYPSAKIELIMLHALLQLKKYNELNKEFLVFPTDFSQSPYFANALYYRAVSDCDRKIYLSCASYLKSAGNHFSELSLKYTAKYYSAWANYKGGNITAAEMTLQELTHEILDRFEDSKYLHFLIALEKEDPQNIRSSYMEISADSKFKQLAVKNLLKKKTLLDNYPILKSDIEKTNIKSPYTALFLSYQNGNTFFTNEEYGKAEKVFINALGLDTDVKSANLLRYNLALIYLKQSKNEDAVEILTDLIKQKFEPEKSRYHLMLALYRLNQFGDYEADATEEDLFKPWSGQSTLEYDVFRAAIKVYREKYTDAVALLLKSYQSHKNIKLLEYAADISYNTGSFNETHKIYAMAPSPKGEKLTVLSALSYLSQNKSKKSLDTIEPFKNSKNHRTRRALIEIWSKNNKNRDIMAYSDTWLKEEKNPEYKFIYLLYNADARYNLGDYNGAKKIYYDLLPLVADEIDQSQIYYNIVTTSYKIGDKNNFYVESHDILKKQLDPEIRFQLVQLISSAYLEDAKPSEADALYVEYEKIYPYRVSEIRERRLLLYYNQNNWLKCMDVGFQPIKNESVPNKINRVILGSKCAMKEKTPDRAIQEIEATLNKDKTYRIDERRLLLADAYREKGEYERSLETINTINGNSDNQEFMGVLNVVTAENLVKTRKFKEAENVLGNPENYRGTEEHSKALTIRADIYTSQKNYKEASRILLKGIFTPTIPELEKNGLRLKLTDVFLAEDNIPEAKKAFKLVNADSLTDYEKQTYDQLSEKLNN